MQADSARMVLNSTQIVLLLALGSALSRAALHIVDRHQIGVRNLSIRHLNFWNNAVPALVMALAAVALDRHQELAAIFMSWRTAVFAAVVQLVAYAFSYAFRHLSVSQVNLSAKLSDLFIPLTLLLTTGYWSWKTFAFALATTLVCLPILCARGQDQSKIIRPISLMMSAVLAFQASISPLLARMEQGDWQYGMLLATAVIAWRTVWSLLPMARGSTALGAWPLQLIGTRLFALRCLLTVVAQITFILAASSAVAAVAWPILNTAGLFATVMAAIVLRERQRGLERIIVLLIAALAAARFFL